MDDAARSAKTSGVFRWACAGLFAEFEFEFEFREESVCGFATGAEVCQRSANESAMVVMSS